MPGIIYLKVLSYGFSENFHNYGVCDFRMYSRPIFNRTRRANLSRTSQFLRNIPRGSAFRASLVWVLIMASISTVPSVVFHAFPLVVQTALKVRKSQNFPLLLIKGKTLQNLRPPGGQEEGNWGEFLIRNPCDPSRRRS